MILNVQQKVQAQVADAIRAHFHLTDVPAFAVEVPPNRALGDLAVTVAFQLARALRKPPKAIAQELAGVLGTMPGIAKVVAAPSGYLNLYLDRRAYALDRLNGRVAPVPADEGKTVVEHTAINPNKAAHIGHLRNATLGDTIVRVLRFRGVDVEAQNYIDDLGVQVADIIVGFREIEHKSLDDVRTIADSTRFDYYCWDLYARVAEWYDGDKDRPAVRARTLHELEEGGNASAEMAALIVDRIVRAHLSTMARLNVAYDLLTYEGDILRLKFWAQAFDILKSKGAVFLQKEGKLAGCWVMTIDDGSESEDEREKVIVRSNGVVTYVGKDIANQFWKFGLLGRDFRYRLFSTQWNGTPLWATTSGETDSKAPAFGRAKWIYNVIDSRQMYLQALLKQALQTLGHAEEAAHSIHFSYEMVALSHATAKELGYSVPGPGDDTAQKPFVEVSGRKGLGVKIDDLLDLLIRKATEEVAKRNPELSAADQAKTASQIAVAAIRYFMLKFSRGKLIVFDIEEAISFEGETGPYLQYAVVRANNIFNKLREREGLSPAEVIRALGAAPADELLLDGEGEGGSLWSLMFEASRLDEVVDQVVRSLEFSMLAKYAFGLAQAFNAFYHRFQILSEEDAGRKAWRAAGVAYVRDQLTRALELMGIDVPSRM
ncbi:MAG TPA: arginine--tRNA ligase [Vicinamibacterales bacterium]|nr:arginine--tRNA ligase [Vicinamibacterales bacterium]